MHCVGPLNTQPGPWNACVVAFQKHWAPLAGLFRPQLGPVNRRSALVPVMGLGSEMSEHCMVVPPTALYGSSGYWMSAISGSEQLRRKLQQPSTRGPVISQAISRLLSSGVA